MVQNSHYIGSIWEQIALHDSHYILSNIATTLKFYSFKLIVQTQMHIQQYTILQTEPLTDNARSAYTDANVTTNRTTTISFFSLTIISSL